MMVSLLALTVSVARADQCAWVDGPLAADAARRLKAAKVLREWCEPCDQFSPSEPLVVTTAEEVPTGMMGLFQVVVNGATGLDLAYTYVPDTKKGMWLNLGLLVGCPAEDVSRSWNESSVPRKPAPPPPVAPLPPPLPAGTLDEQLAAFRLLRIDGPHSVKLTSEDESALLQQQLVRKVEASRALEATVAAIPAAADPSVRFHALWVLFEAHADMAGSLLHSHIPGGLTQEQMEMYRMGLEDRAFPVREKASDAALRMKDLVSKNPSLAGRPELVAVATQEAEWERYDRAKSSTVTPR